MHILLLGLSLLVFQQPSSSQVSFPDRPTAGTYFVDEAGLIDAERRRAINEIAAEQMRLRNIPILVVTIPSLVAHEAAGYTIEEYARALFDAWGIGSEDQNYGMLLLVSRGDRRARIELGRSWAHSRDDQAQRVMNDLILPEFRRERFAAGILAGARGMQAMAAGAALPKRAAPWWFLPAIVGGLAFGLAAVVSLFKSGQEGWAWALLAPLLAALVGIVFRLLRDAFSQRRTSEADGGGSSSGGSGVFEGGSSGGGSSGGGSSGGGGASGQW
ncbi:MAG: TPM domain-containing protein [Gemmatimonadota bacterium]|nr:TPM domain-containing protein [Gemmatimonadota bacterium]